MKIIHLIRQMHREGILGSKQLRFLEALHSGKIMSIHDELRTALYAGILFIAAGAGWTIKVYFAEIGHTAIIGTLTSAALAMIGYCFAAAPAYNRGETASPNIFFDYALLFGCMLYSLDIAYIELNFHILGDRWNNYLLISALFFFLLAYRFDNRLVLSLALTTLAAWFGFKLSLHAALFREYHRPAAIAFGIVSALMGALGYRIDIKKHFLDIYLNVAVNFLFLALAAGVMEKEIFSLYFAGAMAGSVLLCLYAVHSRRFLYTLYAVLYGYLCLSIGAVQLLHEGTAVLVYLIVSSLIAMGLIFKLSRKFGEAA